MAYQITLSDEDYATLVTAAAQRGLPINILVHTAIANTYPSIGSYDYFSQSGAPDTPEEVSEDEELATLFGTQKPWLSDMLLKDRGPR